MHNEKSVPVQRPAQTESAPTTPVKPSDLPAQTREGTIGEKQPAAK